MVICVVCVEDVFFSLSGVSFNFNKNKKSNDAWSYGEIFRYIWKISEKLIMFNDLVKRLFGQPNIRIYIYMCVCVCVCFSLSVLYVALLYRVSVN